MYTTLDYKRVSLTQFGKFDAIWVNLPLQEYVDRIKPTPDYDVPKDILRGKLIATSLELDPWSYEDIKNLPIKELSESQCFLFMWVGSGEYLDKGRDLMKHWGFRRCEDIVWVKTNPTADEEESKYIPNNDEINYDQPDKIFKSTKEHCLVGI